MMIAKRRGNVRARWSVGEDSAKLVSRPWDAAAVVEGHIVTAVLEELRQIPSGAVDEVLFGKLLAAARNHAPQSVHCAI